MSIGLSFLAPFAPHRGGIAAHSTCLRQALGKHFEVQSIGYYEPFPAKLYPGEYLGDLRQQPGNLKDVDYCLSWRLPGRWLQTATRVKQENTQVVLLAWWTFFFAPHIWLLCQRLHREKIPAVFLCHNLIDHEAAFWKRWLCLCALSSADAFIFHSSREQQLANNLLPATRSIVFPHPLYEHIAIPRNQTVYDGKLQLLFIGLVRPYKGLDDLLAAMELLDTDTIQLTIAGEWWGNQNKLLQRCRKLESSGRCRLIDHFVSDDELGFLIASCHAIILPYRQATNSGVLAHALHARKPVVATTAGALSMAVDHLQSGVLVPPSNPLALAEGIIKLKEMIMAGHDFSSAIQRIASNMTWDNLAKEIVGLVSSLDLPHTQ